VILRAAAAVQDRYARFRCRKYRARLPRIAYADDAVRAVKYRKYRPYVLAGVVVYMAGRRVFRPESVAAYKQRQAGTATTTGRTT
jgi:hypothetical protein